MTLRHLARGLSVGGLLLLAVAPTQGQVPGGVSGPVFGYVWSADESALRPLRGLPGSATVGEPVDVEGDVSHAVVADDARMIVSSAASASLTWLDLSSAEPITMPLGIDLTPTVSAVSTHGLAAVLVDGGRHRLAIVTGLPHKPTILHTAELAELTPEVSHVAVSDDGALIAFTAPEATGASLFAWTQDTGRQYLGSLESTGAVAIGDMQRIVVADGRRNSIFMVDADPGGSWNLLANAARGISTPVGLVVLAGGRIAVANAGSGDIITFDSSGRIVQTRHCACEVTTLKRIRDAVYQLTERTDRTLFLFDSRAATSRIVFVPPATRH